MSDLRERFRLLDELDVPELRGRAPRTEQTVHRGASGRILVAAVALLIGVVPVILLVQLIGPSARTPVGGGAGIEGWVVSARVAPQTYQLVLVSPDGTVSDPLNRALPSEIDPTWSPDGSQIAFSGTPKSNTEPEHIYLTDVDGQYPEQITFGPYLDLNPAWSPGGNQIAFSRLGSDGHTSIAVVDVATQHVTVLTAAGAQNVDPAWSPDGTRIAFMRNDAGLASIYVMNADGSDVKQLTNNSNGGGDTAPSWSPDGQEIAFSRRPKANDSGSHIWVMNADGSGQHQITDGTSFDDSPSWSPDGSLIAYLSAPGYENPSPTPGQIIVFPNYNSREMDLYVMHPDGSDQKRVTVDSHVGYSPDGTARFAWDPNLFKPSAGANADGETVGGVTILVSRSGPSGDEALAEGRLTTINGCLAVGSEYVVWPSGYGLTETDGKIWLTNDHGAQVAAIGDRIQMGGASDSLTYAERDVPRGIPSSCRTEGPDHYWIAGTPTAIHHASGT